MSVKPPDRVCMEHALTGEQVCVEITSVSRNLSWAYKNAISLLRSRLFAAQSGQSWSRREVAVYDLPEDTPCPFDLSEYRNNVRSSWPPSVDSP